MADELGSGGEPDPTLATKRPGRSRKWLIALGIVAAVVAGVAVAIDYAPDYLARYLVHNYFQGLNIDTSGVETIDISPLRGEVNFGPVTFRGAEGEPGQVGRIGLKIDVRRLFRRQALLDAVVIEGIRIDIHQAANGEISINGIPLTRILAEQAAKRPDRATGAPPPSPPPPPLAPAPPQQQAQPAPGIPPSIAERLPWGAGLDQLQLRDSRIVFTSSRGGEATIVVNQLDLEGFATWAPDDPGKFRLDGNLNEIHIVIAGQVTPFATRIDVDARLEVNGIELAKIERFAGPLGFDPKAGSADVTVESKGSVITADGRINAWLQGQARLNGIDLASPVFGAIRVADVAVNLNGVRVDADPSGKISVAGDASADLATFDLRLADGTEVGFHKATIALPAFTAAVPVRATPTFKLTPQVDVQALRLGGPDIEGTLATAAVHLSAFDLDLVADGTPFTATGTVTASDLRLTVPETEPIDITIPAVKANLDAARFAFPASRTLIDGAFTLDATNPVVTIREMAKAGRAPPPPMRFGAASLAGTLPTLIVDDGAAGTKVKINSPALDLDRFRMEVPLAPGSEMQLRTGPLQLKSVDVDVNDGETLRVGGRLGLASPELAIALRATAKQERQTTNVDLRRLALDLKEFSYREAGPVSGLTLKGRMTGERVEARIAGEGGGAAKAVEVAGLDVALRDLALETGGKTEKARARFDLAFRSLEAMLPGGSLPMTASIRDVRLADADLDVAEPGAYGFDRLVIGGFDLSATRRAPVAVATTAVSPQPSAVPETKSAVDRSWPPEGLPVIRIGEIGLRESSKIAMIDQTVSPPTLSTIYLDTLSLQNVDSTNPAARSDLRLKARLDNAQLTVDGWALLFKSRPDFDIRANLSDLSLPAINPYVAPQAGLDITDGKLTFGAEGTAQAGQLKAELRPTVAGLRFADRAEAGGDRVGKSIGVPLSTVIGLLEDPDGTIALTVPVEGDLLAPDFNYSSVIWSGVYRVLRALITSPFKLVSASVSLLASAGGGGGSGAAAAPALAPLDFAPGETAVAGPAGEAIVGLRQTLKDRPQMRLALCGVATGQDVDHLVGDASGREREAAVAKAVPLLPDLARERMVHVRDALTDGSGIARDRVPLCSQPRSDPADHGSPRVELGF